MTRTASPTLACVLLLIAFLLLFAPRVSAHHGGTGTDPRCDPNFVVEPGVDLTAICGAPQATAARGDLDAGSNALLPLIGAALVTGTALALVALVATRFGGKPRGGARRPVAKAWWVCPACHSMNAAGRTTCYGCDAAAPAAVTTRAPSAPATPASAADRPAPAAPTRAGDPQPLGRSSG